MSIDIHIADSTIAMSIYNVIAFMGRALTVNEVCEALKVSHFDDIELSDLEKPLEQLARRGWVVPFDKGRKLEIVDWSKRRLIRARSRGNFKYDDRGKPHGGWDGWTTQGDDGSPGFLLGDIAKEMAA